MEIKRTKDKNKKSIIIFKKHFTNISFHYCERIHSCKSDEKNQMQSRGEYDKIFGQ